MLKSPIFLERVVGLVKFAQKCSEINQQYGFFFKKKKDPSMCAFLNDGC